MINKKNIKKIDLSLNKNFCLDTAKILDRVTDGFSAYNNKWETVYINKAGARIFEKKPEELLGKNFWDTIPEAINTKLYHKLHRSFNEQIPLCFEEFYQPLNIWIEVNTYPSEDGISVYYRNISERKNKEQELKATNEILEVQIKERTQEMEKTIEILRQENSYRQHLEVYYQSLLDASPQCIYIKNLQGKITFANRAFLSTLGMMRSECVGKKIYDLYPQELADKYQADDDWVIKTGKILDTIEAHKAPVSDEMTYIQVLKTPVRDFEGKIIGTQGIFWDVSERQKFVEALRQSETRYRSLVIATSQVVCISDAQGKLVTLLNGTNDLTPMELEAKAWGWLDRVHPDELTRTLEIWKKAIADNTPFELETRLLGADGKYNYFLVRGVPVLEADGTLREWVSAFTDITVRKNTEEKVRRSEAKYRELATRNALLNSIASQIRSSLDINRIMSTAAQSIQSLLQIERCGFVWYVQNNGESYWEVVSESINPGLPPLQGVKLKKPQKTPTSLRVLSQEITRIDDVSLLTEEIRQEYEELGFRAILILPIHTQSGEIVLLSCVQCSSSRTWLDSEVDLLKSVTNQLAIAIEQASLYKQSRMTAQKAQEQTSKLEQTLKELADTQAQLVQNEKMSSLGQLVAGIAHEINNPVNFIYGNISPVEQYATDILNLLALYQEYYPQPVREIQAIQQNIDLDFLQQDLPKILASMKIGAERIREIVLSLRNFSRLDEADMKKVDIHEGIDSTLLILQNRLKEKPNHPAIEVVKEYGKLPLVECYAGQLNQVFMNILNNAIDAIDESIVQSSKSRVNCQGIIQICTNINEQNQVIISIKDNGVGMKPEVVKKMFDPFFTTKAVGSGTGLGMSITYRIIEKHGGKLECFSQVGLGTEFLITIPVLQL